MDKQIADAIVKEVLQQEASNNKILDLCKKITDTNLKDKLVHNAGMLIGHSQDLILQIEKIYPDLNPDL
jgi:hypothetical protein